MNQGSCLPNLSLYLFVVLFALTGCAGNGEGLDQNGQPLTGSAGAPLTADFDSIQNNVFTPICTQCHAGANAPLGLRLDAANSYALLVGVASEEVPTLQRVKVGDPNASYLVQKISGTAAVGGRMPLGGPYLPQSTIDAIVQWITNGAPRPTSLAPSQKIQQSASAGLRVLTTSPLDQAVVTTPPKQIVIGFDRELDANLVNSTTVTLERTDDHLTVAANLSVPLVNPSTLLITPRDSLSNGTYRLLLRGSGGVALAGLDSLPLNSQSDATVGQDFSLEFTIAVQP